MPAGRRRYLGGFSPGFVAVCDAQQAQALEERGDSCGADLIAAALDWAE